MFGEKLRSSMRKSWTLAFVLPLLSLTFFPGFVEAQGQTSKPIKLYVGAVKKTIPKGAKADIDLVLHDAHNRPVEAPKDFEVTVELTSPSGQKVEKKATIKKGKSSEKLDLPLNETGIFEIRATQRELRSGSVFIKATPQSRPMSRSRMFHPGWLFAGDYVTALICLADSDQRKPTIQLRCSTARRILADGKDPATITAFVDRPTGAEAKAVVVHLHHSDGRLDPRSISVPADKDYADSTLTSDRPGTIKVSFVSSNPEANIVGEKEYEIKFGPEIHELDLKLSPKEMSLLDEGEVIVQLRDTNGNRVDEDQQREISLAIDSARGVMEQKITIAPGKSEGRTRFYPTRLGTVTISASSTNLGDRTAVLDITLPLVQLGLSAAGGLLGGLLAFWLGENSKWWRVIVGLITGFLLYWGFLFGVFSLLPRGVIQNPFSVFALSIVGGYRGPEVITAILSRLHLLPAQDRKGEVEPRPALGRN